MKKIILVLIVTLLLVGCGQEEQKKKIIFSDEKSSKNLAEIYIFNDGRKLYSEYSNLELKVDNEEKINLSVALENNIITIDYIVDKMVYKDSMNDGGSKLYYNESRELSDTKFYLVTCNSIIGQDNEGNNLYNNNIIVGSSSNIVQRCLIK